MTKAIYPETGSPRDVSVDISGRFWRFCHLPLLYSMVYSTWRATYGSGTGAAECGNRAAGIIHGVYSGRAECHSDRRAKVGNRGRAIEVNVPEIPRAEGRQHNTLAWNEGTRVASSRFATTSYAFEDGLERRYVSLACGRHTDCL